MLFNALIVAFVQNDFWIVRRLLCLGLTLEDTRYIRLLPQLMHQSASLIEKDEEPLLYLLKHIGSMLEPEAGWQLEIGRVIWNTAVELDLVFIKDPTVTDFRISLSRDALASRACASIKGNDMQALQECLADGRLDLAARYRNPEAQHIKNEPLNVTLHHFAVLNDNVQAVKCLAKTGCDRNIPSILTLERRLPIHDCVSIDMFQELLAHGAQATAIEE